MPPTIDTCFDPSREERELREYLGNSFELERLSRYEQQLDEEFGETGDEALFYRTSAGYLYNLTVFAMSATKLPYLRELTRRVKPPARLLDYGCGIGSDGLLLLEAGYRVEFADFNNPSTEYLRWRLARRRLVAPIHDLDAGVPGGFDAAFAFDVIEHVSDPFAFLREIEARAAVVEVNFLEPDPDDTPLHYDLPVRTLVGQAATHRLLCYRILHDRSHLVIYETASCGLPGRILSRVRLACEVARVRGSRNSSATRSFARRAGQHLRPGTRSPKEDPSHERS